MKIVFDAYLLPDVDKQAVGVSTRVQRSEHILQTHHQQTCSKLECTHRVRTRAVLLLSVSPPSE